MYNDLLNFFENECCISNIFMRKHWKNWYITMGLIIIAIILCTIVDSLLERIVLIISIISILIANVFIGYLKVLEEEYKKEFKNSKIYFGWLELLQCYRKNPAFFEIQLSKIEKYCEKKKFTNEQIKRFVQYLDEDLDKKYPKDRKNEMFLTLIIPSTISITTVYITNNQIKDLGEILFVTITSILYTWIVSFTFYNLLGIRKFMVNKRSNLLELKDVLRNIDMDKIKEENKIII